MAKKKLMLAVIPTPSTRPSFVHGGPDFKFITTLVTSQLVGLRLIRLFVSVIDFPGPTSLCAINTAEEK